METVAETVSGDCTKSPESESFVLWKLRCRSQSSLSWKSGFLYSESSNFGKLSRSLSKFIEISRKNLCLYFLFSFVCSFSLCFVFYFLFFFLLSFLNFFILKMDKINKNGPINLAELRANMAGFGSECWGKWSTGRQYGFKEHKILSSFTKWSFEFTGW